LKKMDEVLRIIEDAMAQRGFPRELSHMINRFLEAIGATRYQTYRIDERHSNF